MRAPVGETSEGAKTHIIVADDSADMRGSLERVLRPLRVIELATDGNEALAASRRSPTATLDGMAPG